MRQKLSIALASLSLIVAIVSAALWVRSYWRMDEVERGTEMGMWTVRSLGGRVVYEEYAILGDDPPPPEFVFRNVPVPGNLRSPWRLFAVVGDGEGGWHVSLLGGGWSTKPWPTEIFSSFNPLVIDVPYWFLVVSFAAYPLAAARSAWRWAGHPALACRSCGYDLRATPGRCPECGAVRRTGRAVAA